MVTKQSVAYGAIGLASFVALGMTWLVDDAAPWPIWIWLPVVVLVFWGLWVLRDSPDPSAKLFDFSPKRGLFYFLIGLVIFPLLALIDAMFGAELTLS